MHFKIKAGLISSSLGDAYRASEVSASLQASLVLPMHEALAVERLDQSILATQVEGVRSKQSTG